ncbi:MAG: IgGFc-binding protein [bacterium]
MKKLLQKLSVLFLAIIFISSFVRAVENDEAQLRKDLPKLLGSSNEGTEFFMTFHPGWETAGEVNSCKIYITSAVYTEVTVEIPGKKVLIKRTTNPNDVIEISLDPDVAQCYRKTDLEIPQSQKVYKGYGVIVTAKDPIICYGMTCFASITDGYLAYPKSVLGKKYVVSSYNSPVPDSWKQHLTSYTSIVGVYNNTIVNVKLGGSLSNFTPLPFSMKTGDKRQDTLNRGDVWLIGTMGDYNDVTGTTVDANKPVSVISGSFSALVPRQINYCNYLIEQDLPMETWGYKYHVAPIIRRTAPSIIRIFSSEPNTTIYRDDNEWSLVRAVGGDEGTGYVERRAVEQQDSLPPVTISAKNRIAVTQYNTGQSDDGWEGEPFQMALVPLEQYQKSFVFCTPRKNDGTKFENNYLNLYYKSTIDGKIPDDLEFGTANYGVFNWKKLNTVITSPGKVFIDKSITDSRNYRLAQIELDAFSGVYAIRGNDPMMGNIYGFETSNSYGYLVSAGFRDLSKPDVWAPIPTFAIDCKGNIQGKVIEQPENNELLRSNLEEIRLVKSESSNFKDLVYDEANYIQGTSYIMNWNLGVLDQESDGKAVISFSDRAGNDTTITING